MIRLITLLLISLLTACTARAPVAEVPIMGNLQLGEYAVGFKTLFEYDQTRKGVPYSDWDGNLYSGYDPKPGRQFQVNVWYPAESGTGESMKYAEYVHLMGRQVNFNESEEQNEAARQRFISQTRSLANISQTQGLPIKEDFTQENMEQLLDLAVYARLDAKVSSGKFPVVVYPNGSSPAYQSITCEFLASHGYTVVAFGPLGRFSSGMEISTIGLETAVDDLEFVLQRISELSFADIDRVSLLANAISSSVCALAASRNEKIRTLISLEGGLPSEFEQRLLNGSVSYQPENIKLPILCVYSPHPAIDPKYTFHLKYADRYYAHFPNMSEFVMLNYGMFDSFIPDILGEHEGNTQKGFEQANEIVLRFLNLKVKCVQGELFDPSFIDSQTEIDTTFSLKALPSPPNMAMLKDLFIKNGFDAVEHVYSELKSGGNPQPFSASFYTDYRNWLAWKKDPEYTNRHRLYELAYDSYPESARVNYYLAYYSSKLDLTQKAIVHYQTALRLAEGDEDLSKSEKSTVRENARAALNEL